MTLWQCRLWTLLWWKCARRVSGRVFEKKTAEYITVFRCSLAYVPCDLLQLGLSILSWKIIPLIIFFVHWQSSLFATRTFRATCCSSVCRYFLKNYSSNNFFCALTILAICNPHVPCDLLQLGLSILSWKIIPLIIFFVHWQSSLFATRTFRAICCSSACRYFLEKLFL